MAAAAYFDTVQKIFIAFYQRPADPAGLKYWADRIDAANGDAAAVVSAFATSPEAVTLYGTIDKTTIGAVIDKIYLALFNTTPDAAGKKFYVDGFTAGTFTAGTIALNILNGATNDDAVAIANKLQVSNTFTQQVDGRALTSPYFGTGTSFSATYKGDADAQAARDILKTVTASPSTVLSPSQVTVEIQTKIADAGDPIVGQTSGQTFTLTNVVDNFVGAGGNDTFTGGTAQIQAADTINGAGGTDTAKLYLDTAGAGLNASNVEIFQIQSSFAGGAAFNATNVTGAQEIWSAGSTTALTINGLKNNVTLGLDKTQSALSASFVAGVLGAAETLKLATDASGIAGGRVAVTVNDGGAASKFTTLDVNAVAGKSFISINDHLTPANATTDFTTLKTSGAGTVDLAAGNTANAFNNLTTVELNAAGGSTVNLGANAKAVKVTGGAGNDTVIFANNEFNTQDVIDLGAGTNTLVLGNAGLTGAATTELTKAINAAKGVTTLGTTAGADVAILAARYSAIDSFAVGLGGAVVGSAGAAANNAAGNAGTAAVSVSGVAASGDSLNVQNSLTGGAGSDGTLVGSNGGAGAAGLLVRMALDGGADSFSLSVSENNATITGGKGGAENGAGTAGLAAAGIDAREVETLNIAVSKNLTVVGAAANGNSAAATADVLVGGNATLNITGTGNVNLGDVRANSADSAFQNLNIKAGDLVGFLTVVTGVGNDTIIVGSKGSNVTGGAGQDTITLGAGVDAVNFEAGHSGVLDGAGVIGRIDVINGFTAGIGGDLLDLLTGSNTRGFTQLTSANQTTITNAASLTDAVNAALGFAATGNWTAFSYGDKTYALFDGSGNAAFNAANDVVVELAGVTATALVAANFC